MTTAFLDHYPLLVPALSGAAVGVFVSDTKTMRSILTRGGAGVFCALTFTDMVIAEFGRDPNTYRVGVAGLLALTGFEAIRWLSHLDSKGIVSIIRAIWGKDDGKQG